MAIMVNPEPGALIPDLRQRVLALATGKYAGFNDSHLRQKLVENEDLSLSRESVRRILRKAKRPSPQKRRPHQYRSRCPRRPRFGLMLLTDASRHDWLKRFRSNDALICQAGHGCLNAGSQAPSCQMSEYECSLLERQAQRSKHLRMFVVPV
jgi:hypothetical protein